MFARDVLPHFIDFGHDTAQIGDDKVVLRIEMPVERHLVGAGRLGDGIDADAAKAVAMEQIARRGEDAFAGGVSKEGHRTFRFLSSDRSADPLDRDVTGR